MLLVRGSALLELMRGCLTEVSGFLKQLREDSAKVDAEDFPVVRNGLLFSLDLSVASIHMLGMKLYQAQASGEVQLEESEKVILGMASHFLAEDLAKFIDDALQGYAVDDAAVAEALQKQGMSAGTALH